MHDFYAKYAEFCSSFLPTEFDLDRRTLQVAVELARPDWSAVNQPDDQGTQCFSCQRVSTKLIFMIFQPLLKGAVLNGPLQNVLC